MTIVIVDYESIVIAVRSIVGNDASTFIDINSIISSNSISNDSFSLSESNSFSNQLSSNDSATIIEKGAFSAEDIAQDSGTATDSINLISAVLNSVDSTSILESNQLIQLNITDTGILSESNNISVSLSSIEDFYQFSENDSYISSSVVFDSLTLSDSD
jgi:hypothetical protein